MYFLQRLKRLISFLLAVILSVSLINIPTYADNDVVKIWPRLIIFANKDFTVFGKTHHTMSYYQEGTSPGAQPTFCLEPGKNCRMDRRRLTEYILLWG
ncbi:MAG: hypothetical protein LUH04_11595, partial [Clostridium sp.]|nr:hypothetical protein [Clostridium sp.]